MDSLRKWFNKEFDQLIAAVGNHVVSGTSIIGSREEELAYLAFHKERFYEIFLSLNSVAPERSLRVLDIGTSHLTLLLKERYDHVVTLDGQDGWRKRVTSQGIKFVLHDLRDEKLPFPPNSFDIIIASEVIEHLPNAPLRLLSACHAVLRAGGLVIVTTPNAVSYYHRRDILLGRNPFSMPPLEEDPTGSWHVREYTLPEMREACIGAGFTIVRADYPWYWNRPERKNIISNLKGLIVRGLLTLKPSLRDAMLFVLRK